MISSTRLFVGNLPENTNESELKKAFSCFGELTNLELKSKTSTAAQDENKKFAFVSLSAPNHDIEACIKHFGSNNFHGSQVYVTRARESFLERLQRERDQAKLKENEKNTKTTKLPSKTPILKLSEKLNPRKRKLDTHLDESKPNKLKANSKGECSSVHNSAVEENALKFVDKKTIENSIKVIDKRKNSAENSITKDVDKRKNNVENSTLKDRKKSEAEKKRLESMKKKRQEFKQKQMIIKTGLTSVDNVQNKKVIFSDSEEPVEDKKTNVKAKKGNTSALFEENDSDDDGEVKFEVKKQFEGMNGRKILDLQSRYKSDKRFTLDEKFIDDDEEENEGGSEGHSGVVELGTADEKATQMNILQDVLGFTIKQRPTETENKKNKPKLGMLRFDPLQPDHAKFFAPVEQKPDVTRKSKKKNKDKKDEIEEIVRPEVPKVEVSKEQFYNVSETLKEAMVQSTTFSLRSLFGNKETEDDGEVKQNDEYIPLETKEKRVKNPLDPTERNPFKYDSSDSENEEADDVVEQKALPASEPKAVWKENLFFTQFDTRLKEGLIFFTKPPESEAPKERRELKSLMKKRIYNKDRKNQMFKKKIGGKRKSLKKPYKNKG